MAELAKATDLSPVTERCVGSNPTARIFCFLSLSKNLKKQYYKLL